MFGYFLANTIGGYLATQYGGMPVVLCCMLAASIWTALTPAAAVYLGLYGVVATRFLLGLAEGSFYPSGFQPVNSFNAALSRTLVRKAYSGHAGIPSVTGAPRQCF